MKTFIPILCIWLMAIMIANGIQDCNDPIVIRKYDTIPDTAQFEACPQGLISPITGDTTPYPITETINP